MVSIVTYSCKLEDLGGQIFEYGCDIDGSLGADAHLVLGVLLEEALDTTARELRGGNNELVHMLICYVIDLCKIRQHNWHSTDIAIMQCR